MKERGILFTPSNYGKSERGDKTHTRRLNGLNAVNEHPGEWAVLCHSTDDPVWRFAHRTKTASQGGGIVSITCPYGTICDRLYVKEALENIGSSIQYRRDHQSVRLRLPSNNFQWPWQRSTLSSIHMPKWAARLWLELVEVRVERLQDISEEDSKAEGVTEYGHQWRPFNETENRIHTAAQLRDRLLLLQEKTR